MSGSGAQLSGSGAQLSGSGAQLLAILVCIRTYVISAPLYMHVREILQKYIYESDQGLVAAGYSIYIYYIYIIGIAIKSIGTKAKNASYLS